MTTASHICRQCGKQITRGRPDKKFCDEGCKNLFHNQEKLSELGEIRKIDLQLKKNRRVLIRLFGQGRPDALIERDQLLKAGFEFYYHTHYVTTRLKQHIFTFCYDYGYREVENGRYQIIKAFKESGRPAPGAHDSRTG